VKVKTIPGIHGSVDSPVTALAGRSGGAGAGHPGTQPNGPAPRARDRGGKAAIRVLAGWKSLAGLASDFLFSLPLPCPRDGCM
jgi:hypothetical protein